MAVGGRGGMVLILVAGEAALVSNALSALPGSKFLLLEAAEAPEYRITLASTADLQVSS